MSVSVFTWNINHDVRGLAVGEHECFNWASRRDAVLDVLRKHAHEIVCIQEATHESMGDLVRLLFMPRTHIVLSAITKPRSGMYAFTAVPRSLASVAVQCVIPPPPGGPEMRSPWCIVWITVRATNHSIVVCNTHMPMGAKYRLQLSHHLASELARITPSYDLMVVCGDMNTFPDDNGYEQIRLMLCACPGLYDATSLMVTPSGKRALTTFKPFPMDDGMPANVIPYNLDHVLVRVGESKLYAHKEPVCFDDAASIEFNGSIYGTSDHFPVRIEFYSAAQEQQQPQSPPGAMQ